MNKSEIIFNNLVAFAWSDGLDPKEEEYLFRFAEKNKINSLKAREIVDNKGSIIHTKSDDLKRVILNHIIDLAMVDGQFSTEEIDLCNNFVLKLGIDKSMMVLTQKLLESLNIINKQNENIKASLYAAKRIQRAILPPENQIQSCLSDNFVIYMPKDIVSGDFYWIAPLRKFKPNASKDIIFVSAVDCTGHGVPGAFMSIVGCDGLNTIVSELPFENLQPNEILKRLHDVVGKKLHEDDNKDIKNGMDIAFCMLNKKSRVLQYAGARNSLFIIKNSKDVKNRPNIDEKYIYKNGSDNLYEIKGDRINIGANEQKACFVNHEINMNKGDVFYICSDGYVDQNGGSLDKKFSNQSFRQMLLDIQSLNMEQQREVIIKTIKDWMGNKDQRDDIVVIGVKIN